MTMRDKTTVKSFLASVTLAAALPILAAAQEPDPQPFIKPSMPVQTVSLEFKGGSLADFAAAIRKAAAEVNIVLPDKAKEVRLPELSLASASVESALKAVDALVDEDFSVSVKALWNEAGKPVYALSVRDRRKAPLVQTTGGFPAGGRSVSVFSLKSLTELAADVPKANGLTISVEAILTAIDAGMSLHEEPKKAEIRYHADSGLLFVNGTPAQVDILKSVLQNLMGDLRERRDAAQRERAMATRHEPAGARGAEKPDKR
jgi:hypothetical protein